MQAAKLEVYPYLGKQTHGTGPPPSSNKQHMLREASLLARIEKMVLINGAG